MPRQLFLGIAGIVWVMSAQAWPRVDAQLNAAARSGEVATIDKAIANGANPDQARALAAAVAGRHREAVDDLLGHHADPNAWARGTAYALSGPEQSPVFEAAKLGDSAILRDLVHHGADLNAGSRWSYVGDTPLAYAVRNGEIGAVRLLIEAGADVNHPGANGETPLHNALYGEPNAVEIVQVLLAHGANPDIKSSQGKTAREISYGYGPPGIRMAIERAKPSAPFSRPEDMQSISQVLLCRAADDALIPGYRASTSAAYELWRAPRVGIISQIESTAEFRNSLTQLLRDVTPPAQSPGQSPGNTTDAAALQSQCDLVLPPELAPAHPSPAAERERLGMVLICKATYDVLVSGYAVRTREAYARWRTSHRIALGQIESDPQFREQRAEALRELTPVGLGRGSVQIGTAATAETICARLMPPSLRVVAVEPPRDAGAAPPTNDLRASSGSSASGVNQGASQSAAVEEPISEGSTPAAVDSASSPASVNQPRVKVKVKQVIRSAPRPIDGGISPPSPQ